MFCKARGGLGRVSLGLWKVLENNLRFMSLPRVGNVKKTLQENTNRYCASNSVCPSCRSRKRKAHVTFHSKTTKLRKQTVRVHVGGGAYNAF